MRRHSLGQTDAPVGGSIRRHVAFVHGVTAVEMHAVWHPGGIEMRAGRGTILADVDVRLHNVAVFVHVIPELARVVVAIFGHDLVMAGRSTESGFAGRNRR